MFVTFELPEEADKLVREINQVNVVAELGPSYLKAYIAISAYWKNMHLCPLETSVPLVCVLRMRKSLVRVLWSGMTHAS